MGLISIHNLNQIDNQLKVIQQFYSLSVDPMPGESLKMRKN